jgi:hypothetical protein
LIATAWPWISATLGRQTFLFDERKILAQLESTLEPIVRVTQRCTLCGADEIDFPNVEGARGLRQVPQVQLIDRLIAGCHAVGFHLPPLRSVVDPRGDSLGLG